MAETAFKPTKLLWDNYIEYLIDAIIDSNCSRRTERKPMGTPKRAEDSHVTSRFVHEIIAALNARKIARELAMNGDFAFTSMLFHDVGHPFSAHEGEEILNLIGRINNTGYFHHNAKGVEVIISEDICNKAIDSIPNIENHPEIRKQLQEEFYSFLDMVISHDGEATKDDVDKEVIEYSSMKKALDSKLTASNAKNQFRHIAQTAEGKIAKIVDVISYLVTDIVDGFRLGIIDTFNTEYLIAFGDMFSEEGNLSPDKKIAKAKEVLRESQLKTLRERRDDRNKPNIKRILGYVDETFEEAKQIAEKNGSGTYMVLTDDFIEAKRQLIEETIKNREKENWDDQKEQMLMSDMNTYTYFMKKMSHVSTDVARDITRRMKNYFINDFINNSKKTGKLGFSPKAEKLFYKMKELNYKYIVKSSRWDYQIEEQPDAARQLVNLCKSGLIKSGTIRDMFYDESIRDEVYNDSMTDESKDKEALEHMRTPKREEDKYQKYKRKIKSPKRKAKDKKAKYKKAKDKKINRNKLILDVIDYTRKKGTNFAIKYKNVYLAIPNTVKDNVNCALKNEIKCRDYLQDIQKKSNNSIRKRIIDIYGSIDIDEKQKEEFINMLIVEEREKMEEKMAIQLAIDYIGGMTDQSFNDLAQKTGFIKGRKFKNPHRNKEVQNVKNDLARLGPDRTTGQDNDNNQGR